MHLLNHIYFPLKISLRLVLSTPVDLDARFTSAILHFVRPLSETVPIRQFMGGS